MSISDSSLTNRLGRLFASPWLAWVTLLVSVALLLGLWQASSADDAERSAARFQLRAEMQRDLLSDRLRDYELMLQGAAALFHASRDVSRGEWGDYVRGLDLDSNLPGVLGTGFALMLRPGERGAHEAVMRAQGFPDYAIRPPGDRPWLSTILYLEPFTDDNLRAFGYDMFSEPVRRAAMERAADTGRPALSGMVALLQEGPGEKQAGFLIYNPVYRKGMPLTTVGERWAALLGFTYSPFRAQAVLGKIFGTSHLDVEVEVFDGPPDPDRLLFASAGAARQARHMMLLETVVAAHPWTLRVRSSEAFEAETRNSGPLLILLGGLLFSLLLFVLLYLQTRHSRQMAAAAAELERHRHHLEDMVLQRTRELAAAKDAAESANRAKSLVLANLSHELRTPLNHIIGANALLRREVASAKGREWLDMMGKSASSLLRLITNLLEMAKLEAEQLKLEEDDFELAWLLLKLERDSQAAVAAKGLALVCEVAPDVPTFLHGDLRLLERVLGELVDNAVKFSEVGAITLRITRRLTEHQLPTLRFAVEDQGIGVGDKFRQGLFQLFNQGDASATRKYGGTGLGLALCKRIVSLMAGEIGFATAPGGGSTFWIEVPLAEGGVAAAPGSDEGAVRGRLAALIAALRAGAFDAQAQWSELAPVLAPALGDRLPLVEEAIAGFDFEVAAAILAELPAELPA